MLIDAKLLKAIAPGTPGRLRDRFLPYLNAILPRYEITSELRVAAFLATCCIESDHFKTTKEYKAKPGTKAGRSQAKYWPSGFFGRGLIQLTHHDNYQAFQKDVGAAAGLNVVTHPEIIEQLHWAVEASAWFWKRNKLNHYADMGLNGFHALEGVVNTGRPNGNAWGYDERLAVYKRALSVMPDGFVLSSTSTDTDPAGSQSGTPQEPALDTVEPAAGAGQDVPASDPVPVAQDQSAAIQNAENITNVTTGDKTIPDNFVPQDKSIDAPAKEGSTTKAATLTIGGFAVPTFLVGVITAAKSAIENGYVSAGQIGQVLIDFISGNSKYVFAGLGLVIVGLFLKKLYKQVTLWMSMYYASRPDRHDVTVRPQ